jgi:hypothetical protein
MPARASVDSDFSSLFEFLPIGAYRSTPEGRQLRANTALARLNGFASELEQLAAVDDIGGQWYVDPQRRAEFMRLVERDGQVVGFEAEVYRYKSRERIWISENAHLVRDAQGRCTTKARSRRSPTACAIARLCATAACSSNRSSSWCRAWSTVWNCCPMGSAAPPTSAVARGSCSASSPKPCWQTAC